MKMQNNTSAVKEFSSHSSWLYNDRLAVLFYLIDMESVRLNEMPINSEMIPGLIRRVKSLNFQVYKNIRMVVRSDPIMRKHLGLDTKHPGVYTTDIQAYLIDEGIRQCDEEQIYTPKRCKGLISELNNFEMSMKDILQYNSYFIRVKTKAKPDMIMAAQRYKSMADRMTIEQLKSVVGKNHKINFEALDQIPQIEEDADDDFDEIDEDDFDEDDDE